MSSKYKDELDVMKKLTSPDFKVGTIIDKNINIAHELLCLLSVRSIPEPDILILL